MAADRGLTHAFGEEGVQEEYDGMAEEEEEEEVRLDFRVLEGDSIRRLDWNFDGVN